MVLQKPPRKQEKDAIAAGLLRLRPSLTLKYEIMQTLSTCSVTAADHNAVLHKAFFFSLLENKPLFFTFNITQTSAPSN